MRVTQIKIRNLLGIENLEITPGKVTVISGDNGKGKTSVIESLRSLIEGGHDATLLRAGQEVGEAVLVLEDGTKIAKRVTAKTSALTVKDPLGAKVDKPQSYLASILDSLSVNPVEFLTAPAKKRAEYLLETMPIEVSDEQLRQALGRELTDYERSSNALDCIARARKAVFDERTGVNRSLSDKLSTADELEKALPTEAPADVKAELEKVKADHAKEEKERQDRLKFLATEGEKRKTVARTETEAAIQELNHQIQALRAKFLETSLEIDEDVRRGCEMVEGKWGARAKALAVEQARLTERLQEQARTQTTRGIISKSRAEADLLHRQSENLTATLERLDALKESLLRNLPIKGLVIENGQVSFDGTPFERLNRATQVMIAIRIARLRAGELPLILVDNFECMSPETQAAFEAYALKNDLQFVVTRVSSGPLTVETKGAA